MEWPITFHNLISILKETQVLLSERHAFKLGFKILIPTRKMISGSPGLQGKPVLLSPNTVLRN